MLKKGLAIFVLFLLLISNLCLKETVVNAEEADSVSNIYEDNNSGEISYFNYNQKYSKASAYNGFVSVEGDKLSNAQNMQKSLAQTDEKASAVLNQDNNWCEWNVTVPEDGRYCIYVDYYALAGTGKEILLSMYVDGKLPYTEAKNFRLPRLWKDIVNDEKFAVDSKGDDIQPEQEECNQWQNNAFIDVEGLYSDPYFVFLPAGTHVIRLGLNREAVAISKLSFGNEEKAHSYEEYISQYNNSQATTGDTVIRQAEMTYEKNTSLIYPTYDRNDASTQPNTPGVLRLNTIGQSNWNTVGDSISWKADVPEAGLYQISFRARQNVNQGMKSYRTLMVNGNIPFSQAENIAFPYSQKWYIKTLGDDTPYLVYLKPGDIITLSCVSAEMSKPLRNIRQSLLKINALYRNIIAVTSTDPDIYRDYSLESQIPQISDQLSEISEFVKETADMVSSITGTRGSQASELDYMATMLTDFAKDPESIPERLSYFKDAINDIGSMITSLGQQPLELDYLAFVPDEGKTPSVNVGFFSRVSFGLKLFISSFTEDYTGLDNKENNNGKTVNVWVSTGRDQMRIIKNLISDSFTPEYGININLNMVDTSSTLIKASLSGKGPDVALLVGGPMELAFRGALVDISKYDLSDIYNQYNEETWTPYKYNGGIYALPETENFDMMFYRTDVFEELGLSVPQTWDDFYRVMEVLHKSQLLVGIPEINSANMGVSEGINTFYKFLIQSGDTYFNDNKTAVNFNTEKGYLAFEKWVELYREYGLSRQYDFYSRFRTGEMPLAIQNYTAYNQLSQAAPELKGLWSFAPIPGTLKENGTIDRSENAAFTGCIMLKAAVKKGIDNEAATFLKWWVSNTTQTAYAQKLEGTMGIAARYTPANNLTLQELSWSTGELEALTSQMSYIKPLPAVPGNYLIGRSLTTAFRGAVSGTSSVRQALTVSVKSINDEITHKRKEFNLE